MSGEDPDERKANALKQSLDYIDIFLDKVLISILVMVKMKIKIMIIIINPPVFLLCRGPVDHRGLLDTGQRHPAGGDGLSDHILPVSISSCLIIFSSYSHHISSYLIIFVTYLIISLSSPRHRKDGVYQITSYLSVSFKLFN